MLSLDRIQAGCMEVVAFEVGLKERVDKKKKKKGWIGFKHMEKDRMTSQAEERQTP